MVGKTTPLETEGMKEREMGRMKLAPRTESVVRFPVVPGSPQVGMINKRELQKGVFLAASLTKVVNGFAMTSILNTTEVELEVQIPVVELDEVGSVGEESSSAGCEYQDRERNVLTQLRVDHLNAEEKKLKRDVFRVLGYILLTRR
jgi:hypothetical protein